jgi:hypothetical protein
MQARSNFLVMAGLDPAIHELRHTRRPLPWMAGTSLAMTR